jgi:hypothetical protein
MHIESLFDPATSTFTHIVWDGNPPERPEVREVEFSKKEVLREEVKIYGQPNHGCVEAC